MSYAGEARFRFNGPANECQRYIPVARVLVERTYAMFDIGGGGADAATQSQVLKDGTVIKVTVFAQAMPIITITAGRGGGDEFSERLVGPIGLLTQATPTGVGADDTDPNYVLRYDGKPSTWYDVYKRKNGVLDGIEKRKWPRIPVALWNEHGGTLEGGEATYDTFGFLSHMGRRLASCFTHVVKHPETGTVVAINGGLQIHGKPVLRSGDLPPTNTDAEVVETSWMAFSTDNTLVYIHTDVRDVRPSGDPSGDLQPHTWKWGWHGVPAESQMRFYVSSSPSYATAIESGELVTVPMTSVAPGGEIEYAAFGALIQDISSDGRRVVIRSGADSYGMSFGARPVIDEGAIHELEFSITTNAEGDVTAAAVTTSLVVEIVDADDVNVSLTTSNTTTREYHAWVALETGTESQDCASGFSVQTKAYYEIMSVGVFSDSTAMYAAIAEIDTQVRRVEYEYTFYVDVATSRSRVVTEKIPLLGYYDTDAEGEPLKVLYKEVEEVETSSGSGAADVTLSGTFSKERLLIDSVNCNVGDYVWDVSGVSCGGGVTSSSSATMNGYMRVTDGSSTIVQEDSSETRGRTTTVTALFVVNSAGTGVGFSAQGTETATGSADITVPSNHYSPSSLLSRTSQVSGTQDKPSLTTQFSAGFSQIDISFVGPWDNYNFYGAGQLYEERVLEPVCNKCLQPVSYYGTFDQLSEEWIARGPVLTPRGVVYDPLPEFMHGVPLYGGFGEQSQDYAAHRMCAAYNAYTGTLVANQENPVAWNGLLTIEETNLVKPKKKQVGETTSLVTTDSEFMDDTWEVV